MPLPSSVSPGSCRRENLRFLFFCAALIQAADAVPADVTLDADLDAAVREVVADSYRRHRANTREFALS